MTLLGKKTAARLAVVFALTGLCGPAASDPLAPLSPKERSDWTAVGLLSGPSYSQGGRGCSGTLIAPDLVVSAAHCLTGALWNPEHRKFSAGAHFDRNVAERLYEEVFLHPLYFIVRGPKRFEYDLAVVRLKDPIPSDVVTPMPLLDDVQEFAPGATLLGYQHKDKGALSGSVDCPKLSVTTADIWVFDCDVKSGASGGAVISQTENGPVLAAIIVGRQLKVDRAIAVPVNLWLKTKYLEALERAKPLTAE